MGRTAGRKVSCHAIQGRSPGWHHGGILIIAILCIACTFLFASEAVAQCSARDVLRNHLKLKQAPSGPQIPIKSAVDVPAWKTIRIGTFANFFALSNALDAAGCGIGNSAGEILARPTFTVSATTTSVEFSRCRQPNWAFGPTLRCWQTSTRAPNNWVSARRLQEIGPQLRLQYFDQPIGEFLIIGMEPIRTGRAPLSS